MLWAVRGCQGVLGAGRECRYSGVRRGIGGIRGHFGALRGIGVIRGVGESGDVGCQWCIRGLAGNVGTQGLQGI